MFFWKKDKAREILSALKEIRALINSLRKFEDKKGKTKEIIIGIKTTIGFVENEIRKILSEEKKKPWVDARFDAEIDGLAEREIILLNKLANDLDFYEQLVESSKNQQELDDVLDSLVNESKDIFLREKQTDNLLKKMETETLKLRLSTKSDVPPALRTLDGAKWSSIATVVKELGGWIVCEKGGSHRCKIFFPNSERPVMLSKDIACNWLAASIREQLKHLPTYKKPNVSELEKALKRGELVHA